MKSILSFLSKNLPLDLSYLFGGIARMALALAVWAVGYFALQHAGLSPESANLAGFAGSLIVLWISSVSAGNDETMGLLGLRLLYWSTHALAQAPSFSAHLGNNLLAVAALVAGALMTFGWIVGLLPRSSDSSQAA